MALPRIRRTIQATFPKRVQHSPYGDTKNILKNRNFGTSVAVKKSIAVQWLQKAHYISHTYPKTVNSLTSIILFGFSDWIAQLAETKDLKRMDSKRIIAVAMCGPIFNGIILTAFYNRIDRRFGMGTDWKTVARKIIALQTIYTPISVPSFLFLSKMFHISLQNGTIKGSYQPSFDNAKNEWKSVYISSWFVWPVSDCFNLRFIQRVAPALRPTWDAIFGVGWTAYLSWSSFWSDYHSHCCQESQQTCTTPLPIS